MSQTNDLLFSKLMSICVKECQQSIQSIQRKIELKVEIESRFGIEIDNNRREVIIRLSDLTDPFFLYITSINEQLFNRIKSSENLLIDFNSFPKKLMDLFETCFEEQNKDNSRFMLSVKEMNKELIILEVIEMNAFKHLIHFSLKIPAANQEFIKSSFSHTFRNLKLENERLENRLHSIGLQLNENSLSKAKELEIMENEYKLQIKEIEIKFKKEIELQKHLINELMAKESESKSLNQKLQTQLETVEQNVKREQTLNEQKDLQTITAFNNKIVSLEEELCKTRELYNKEKCETVRVLAVCEEKQNLLDDCLKNNGLLKQDLSKANDIIRKLQTQVQSTHQKLSLLNRVATKQEEAVGVKQSTVDNLQSDLRLCEAKLKIKDQEYQHLRKDFDLVRNKCNESEEQIKTNENVITFLNKQISELQLKHGIKSNTIITQTNQSILPKVNLIHKQTAKTNPKVIAQRNSLFVSQTLKSDNLFKR